MCWGSREAGAVPAVKRRVPVGEGRAAVAQWLRSVVAPDAGRLLERDAPGRAVVATAVRYLLEELAALVPGRSVEVRVPPFGAVQCVEGLHHRRGTPPAVVEMDAETWLALATGREPWDQAVARAAVHASGQRTDLSHYLPLYP
jgi:hypothetical protein